MLSVGDRAVYGEECVESKRSGSALRVGDGAVWRRPDAGSWLGVWNSPDSAIPLSAQTVS